MTFNIVSKFISEDRSKVDLKKEYLLNPIAFILIILSHPNTIHSPWADIIIFGKNARKSQQSFKLFKVQAAELESNV